MLLQAAADPNEAFRLSDQRTSAMEMPFRRQAKAAACSQLLHAALFQRACSSTVIFLEDCQRTEALLW